MTNIIVTWDELDQNVSLIKRSMVANNYKPDLIVGIMRGGIVPAVMLSHRMGVPCAALEWSFRDSNRRDITKLHEIVDTNKSICFVDDIIDSGMTVSDIDSTIKEWYPFFTTYRFAALWHNTNQPFAPHYRANTIDRSEDQRWVCFPFENN